MLEVQVLWHVAAYTILTFSVHLENWEQTFNESSHKCLCELPTAPGPEIGAAQMWPKDIQGRPKCPAHLFHLLSTGKLLRFCWGNLRTLSSIMFWHVMTMLWTIVGHCWTVVCRKSMQILPAQPAIPPPCCTSCTPGSACDLQAKPAWASAWPKQLGITPRAYGPWDVSDRFWLPGKYPWSAPE